MRLLSTLSDPASGLHMSAKRRIDMSERQLPPHGEIGITQRPFQPLPDDAVGIDHLITQAFLVERGLNAMQILDLLRHSVRGSRTGCRDLQHAAMHLNIEGEDMTADVSEDIVCHQKIPELLGMLQTDLANIRA